MARQGTVWHGKAQLSTVWQDTAQHSMAWHGMAGQHRETQYGTGYSTTHVRAQPSAVQLSSAQYSGTPTALQCMQSQHIQCSWCSLQQLYKL